MISMILAMFFIPPLLNPLPAHALLRMANMTLIALFITPLLRLPSSQNKTAQS